MTILNWALCGFSFANPPETNSSEFVRHPLLSTSMAELLASPEAEGLSAAEVYAQVRVFQSATKLPDGTFRTQSGVVWANNDVVIDNTQEPPTYDPDTQVIDARLASDLLSLDPATTVDIDLSTDRSAWFNLVGVRHQQARQISPPVWSFIRSDISGDNRQRVWYEGSDLGTGGGLWRVRIYGPSGVTSDNEGCGTDSNRVYYTISWEDNSRNDDSMMQTYVRPEEDES